MCVTVCDLVEQVRQNVLDVSLHIAQYSNIIADLRDEIRRLRQKLDQQHQAFALKHGTAALTGNHGVSHNCAQQR